MRKSTKQSLQFKAVSGKQIFADFNGGELTSDAGLLFLREIESNIGIIKDVASVLPDSRHLGYVKHSMREMLTQRVFQIAAGYEDANDSNFLRHDPVLKLACNRLDDALASQSTMTRFENGFGKLTQYRIAKAFVDNFIRSYKKPPEAIILDIDDTEDKTYGAQQLVLFNAYHNSYCYMPIHIYEGQSGKLVTTILRPGKRPSGRETLAIIKRIVRHIRKAWPEVGILLRGDSHYASKEVMDYCEDNGLFYIFGLTTQQPMEKTTAKCRNEAETLYNLENKPVKLFGEFMYKASSWRQARRVIYKAEHNEKGDNLRCIITNLENQNIGMVYGDIYCGRGKMELFIKEHKCHLFSDRTSCSSFMTNQFRLFLHSIAYVLMYALRETCLQNTQFSKAQFDTIRLKILKIGARIVRMSTKIKIHLPTAFPYQDDLYQLWQNCVT